MTTTSKGNIGAEATAKGASKAAPSAPRANSKIGKVVALLERKEGATLDEMVEATGWQAHTARAALTGLKKRGYEIERNRRDDVSVYRAEVSS